MLSFLKHSSKNKTDRVNLVFQGHLRSDPKLPQPYPSLQLSYAVQALKSSGERGHVVSAPYAQ